MSPQTFEVVRDLFVAATGLPPEARAECLGARCRENDALRREVELLLAHAAAGRSESGPGFLGFGVVQPAQPPFPLQAGSRVGNYILIETIGEGGMGLVFKAEQREPVQRAVALKLAR